MTKISVLLFSPASRSLSNPTSHPFPSRLPYPSRPLLSQVPALLPPPSTTHTVPCQFSWLYSTVNHTKIWNCFYCQCSLTPTDRPATGAHNMIADCPGFWFSFKRWVRPTRLLQFMAFVAFLLILVFGPFFASHLFPKAATCCIAFIRKSEGIRHFKTVCIWSQRESHSTVGLFSALVLFLIFMIFFLLKILSGFLLLFAQCPPFLSLAILHMFSLQTPFSKMGLIQWVENWFLLPSPSCLLNGDQMSRFQNAQNTNYICLTLYQTHYAYVLDEVVK